MALIRYGATLALASWAFVSVQQAVPAPYLDEIFHIPQTLQYYNGNWKHWDPKITTPPGLYGLGAAYCQVTKFLNPYIGPYIDPYIDVDGECSVASLRFLNLIGVTIVVPLAVKLMGKSTSTATAVSTFPLLAFFGLLYYTDVWSTAAILISLALVPGYKSKNGANENPANGLRHVLSALVALAAVFFRQTNVVWAAVVAVYAASPRKVTTRLSVMEDFVHLIQRLIASPSVVIPFGLIGALFAAFVFHNGSIALGDKSNHVAGVNIPQLLYFSLFFGFFSWPLWLTPTFIRRYIQYNFGSAIRVVGYLLGLGAIATAIDRFTIVHPFLLADNRHYTFYLWRRLIAPVWGPSFVQTYGKFALVPVYHVLVWTFLTTLFYASTASFALSTAVLGATVLTLVPSPLFEPRYYIVPYTMWRLLQQRPSKHKEWLEWAWYMTINVGTVLVFVKYEFEWPGQGMMRFMW